MADLPDLRHVPLFKGLTSAELERLARNCVRLEPRDGSEVFAQGDPANAVYAIVAGDGRVRIIATDRRSKALLAEIFHNGDCFGEMGVMDGGTRSAGAIAEGLSNEEIAERLVVESGTVANHVAAILSRHTPEAMVHLAALHFIPACVADPARTVSLNVHGTQSVLSAARDAGVAPRQPSR